MIINTPKIKRMVEKKNPPLWRILKIFLNYLT